MLNNNTLILLSLMLLTSCTSVIDRTIPLSDEFQTSADLIVVKTPLWRFPDSVYDIKVGEYQTVKADTSFRTTHKELVDTSWGLGLLTYLLDDELFYLSEEYKIEAYQRFSFSLQQAEQDVSSANCEIFSQNSAKEQHIEKASSSYQPSTKEHRLKTFLICGITIKGQNWQLTLNSNAQNNTTVTLKNETDLFKVESLSNIITLTQGENGIEKTSSPPWLPDSSGLEFYRGDLQVAAYSFVGDPKIWVRNDIPLSDKEVLFTASYSLTLFNWLDSKWR